jgi:hypothetical protein
MALDALLEAKVKNRENFKTFYNIDCIHKTSLSQWPTNGSNKLGCYIKFDWIGSSVTICLAY